MEYGTEINIVKFKCPKCNSKYTKKFSDVQSHCSNKDCVLYYHETKKVEWDSVWRKIRYSSPRDVYYYFKNRFFMRYDLIRTGVSKSDWCDKDYLLLEGMMGLLVAYIEKECPFECTTSRPEHLETMPNTTHWEKSEYEVAKKQVTYYQEFLDLYIDWKVTYPKMQVIANTLLMSGADDKYSVYREYEEKVDNFEQYMLHKLVDIRKGMWT